MLSASRSDSPASDVGLSAMLDSLLSSMRLADPDLAQAVIYCAIPRWFDRQVVAGICTEGAARPLAADKTDAILAKLRSLTFCGSHPTRADTWVFRKAFRDQLLGRPELTARWQELHACAATAFRRMLEAKGIEGDRRFQDDDWRLVATEWLYHLLQVDPDAGLAMVTRVCAEALAVPVYQGPSWEIDFCVRLLADLEPPADAAALNAAIEELRREFGYMAAGQNWRALALIKRLAAVPGLTPAQEGELRRFAGVTHLWDEGKIGPALEELERAAQLTPALPAVHAAISAAHLASGISWGRLDLAEASAREAMRVGPAQPDGYVALGNLYAQQEDWEQAMASYRTAIELAPEEIDAYLALSDVHIARREVRPAIELIDRVWQISPGSEYYAAIRKGNAHAAARDFASAGTEFERAVSLGPDLAATYVALGGWYERLFRYAEAAEKYEQAIRVEPAVADGYVALARLYDVQGKLPKAVAVCQRWLDACGKPEVAGPQPDKSVYIVLSGLYEQMDRLADLEAVQEQIVALDRAERYSSRCAIASAWLARARKRRGSPDAPAWLARAQARLEEAVALDERRAWAYLLLGELYVLRGEYDRLDDVEGWMASRAPWGRYDLLVGLGRACLQEHEGARSEMFLARAAELAPGRVAAWQALGDLYAWRGDPDGVARAWAGAVAADPALRYDALLAQGDVCLAVKDYARARQQFTRAIELEPDTAIGYLRLASVAEAEGDPDEASELYRAAGAKASGVAPLAFINIARSQREGGQLLAAERTLRRAMDLDPESFDACPELARLGVACDREDLIAEACRWIASALPDQQYDFWAALGDAWRLARRFDEARQALDRCRELDPLRPEAWVGLAQLFMDQERPEDARQAVDEALRVDRASSDAWIVVSRLCDLAGDADGVIAAERKVVEIMPVEQYNALISMGRACEKTGQPARAEEHYRAALALCPWRPDAYIGLGLLLTARGASAEVEQLFERARADAGVGYLELGRYLENEEKLEEAHRIYAIGMKHASPTGQIELYGASARLHHRLKQLDEAIADLERAIALDPARPEAYVALAELYLAERRPDDAVAVCRRMAEQPALAYNAAMSLANLGLLRKAYADAERAYRRAIGFAPVGSPDPYVQLGQLLTDRGRPEAAARVYRQMARLPGLAGTANVLLGDLWLGQGKAEGAEKAYRRAIRAEPQAPGGYLRLAQLYRQLGDLPEAEALVELARQLAPDSSDPYVVLAQLREEQGRADEAVALYRQLAQLRPAEASAAYERIGDLLIGQERYDEAATALRQALAWNPASAGACFSLGTLCELQGDLEGAADMYGKAIDADPSDPGFYLALGRIYARQGKKQTLAATMQQVANLDLEPQGRYEVYLAAGDLYRAVDETGLAEASYERAIELDPGQGEGYLRVAQLHADAGRLDDAIGVCGRMAEQPALAYNAAVSLGNLWAAKQAYAKAGRAYRRAIELAPEVPEAYMQLGQLLADRGKPEAAARVYRQMAQQPGLAGTANVLLGDLRLGQGNPEGAGKAYRRAIQAEPGQPVGYLRLAQLYQQLGDPSGAEALIEQARQLAPDSSDPDVVLAQVREQQGRVDEAVELYRRLAQIRPDEASAAYERIGDLLIGQARYEEAAAALQEAVARNPANAGAYFSLGSVRERQGDLEGAAAMYAKALEANPKYLDACVALGHIYGQQRATAKIAGLGRQLLGQQLEPAEQYDAHMVIGSAYQEARALEWAADEFRAALELDRERPDAHLALAAVYELQQRYAEARAMYGQVAVLVPQWQADVHRKLGELYEREGAADPAEQEYRRAIELAPERAEACYALALLYMGSERWSEAMEAWERVVRLPDVDPITTCSAYLYLADIHRTLGDADGMAAACAKVTAIVDATESPNSDLLRQRGLALFMQGEHDDAAASLAGALAANPDDVRAHFYLALNLLCQGRRAEAEERLEQGLARARDAMEFDSALREAKALVARTPEVPAAGAMLEALQRARAGVAAA